MVDVREPIIRKFLGQLPMDIKDALADNPDPVFRCLAALYLAETRAGLEDLSVNEISIALREAGVAVSNDAVMGAIIKAGEKVSRVNEGWITRLRLMTLGRREVQAVLDESPVMVFYADGKHPRSSRRQMAEVLGGLAGEVRIVDPYFGPRTLETLDLVPASCHVRFLTEKIQEQELLARPLRDFLAERRNTEIRKLEKPTEIHDRYVLTDETLLLVGHGLKDIGSKESFVVGLSKSYAEEMMKGLATAFDARWAAATPVRL